MASFIPYLIGGAVLGGIVLASGSAEAEVSGGVPAPAGTRQKRFRCAFAATGLGDDWMRFLEQTARRESNFKKNAHNGTTKEREASAKLADRVGTVGGINFDRSSWKFGSKGLFQFLGPVVAVRSGRLRFPKGVTNPNMGYDPGVAVAAAVDYARGLMKWKNFEGSWASLNIGWGWPAKMGDTTKIANSARKMEDRAAKLGWERGWARQKVPVIRDQTPAELAALASTSKLYYNAC